jgi:cytidylate kinase
MIDNLVGWYLALFLENRPDRLLNNRESPLAQDVRIKAVLDRRLQLDVWVHGAGADIEIWLPVNFVIRLERGRAQNRTVHKKPIDFELRAVGGSGIYTWGGV